ncbi:hypothetical protein FUA23_13290 [Neolewinella aurantiaca]|uniref:Outer membrane protein beta-barrel domain-containing protein n=1 Tax=Neolewinella aurantiaca TaxID=2602767 RepID=A0A5C7FDQ8_9BACT|nr:hypothetical protein [Neolewinella aurantiaca]TXF88817.1 hypothetical protein FUA23_13290 [Neolewinella aurantiaca]
MPSSYLFPLLLLLCSITLSAQNVYAPQYTNTFTISLGLHQGYFKDQNFSPLNYRASGLRVGFGYARNTKGGNRWHTGLGFGLTELKSGIENQLATDRFLLDVSVGYLKGLAGNDEDKQHYLGGNFRSYVDISIFDGAEAITFYGLHAFELAGALNWKTGNKHRLTADASLPVFGLLSRPPYSGWDKFIGDNSNNIPKIITRGDWTTIGDFFGLRAGLGWQYQLGQHWALGARYDVAYYTTRQIDPVRILNNTFSVQAVRSY